MTRHICRNSKHKSMLKLASAWHTVGGSAPKSMCDGGQVSLDQAPFVPLSDIRCSGYDTFACSPWNCKRSPSIKTNEIVVNPYTYQPLKFLSGSARPSWTT